MVAYRAYRYNDGSANNAELKREVEVKSAEEALKVVERIEKAAKRYDDVEDTYEERENYLMDWLIGGACGGFFYPGAKAYVDHIRREVLQAPAKVEGAA
jgi:hypothetical protein